MIKTVIIIYLVCLACYVPFSRTPDYFEAEKVPAVIHTQGKENGLAVSYSVGGAKYDVDVSYPLRRLHSGDKVVVIYDPASPSKGVLYRVWGYWLTLTEVIFSMSIFIVLFAAAVFITGKNSNIPYTADELRKKPKYKS